MEKKLKNNTVDSELMYSPHDGFYKRNFKDTKAAEYLFKGYLPSETINSIDLSTLKVESEGFVEENLQRNTSDILYSAKINGNKDLYLYLLCEHKSYSDRYVAFQLAKYMMLIWEEYKNKKQDFPVILPVVLFNGKNSYNAPRNLWSLSNNPKLAKKFTFGDYFLIDLQSMSDEEIDYSDATSFVLYIMKHIHDKDIIAPLRKFIEVYGSTAIAQDKKNNYKRARSVLYYIENKISKDEKIVLNDTLIELLPDNDGEEIMITIADSYRKEGKKEGKEEEKVRMAKSMLRDNEPVEKVIKHTGLSKTKIQKIQDSLSKSTHKKAS